MFFPYYFDPTMIIIIPALILAMYAQFKVKGTYGKYSQVLSHSGMTGAEVARELLRQNGIYNVAVQQVGGYLSDHYDPTGGLSTFPGHNSLHRKVAAHEVGHAIQYALNYRPLRSGPSCTCCNLGKLWTAPGYLWFFINSGL